MLEVPEPPTGMDDLHVLPSMASDRELHVLQSTLAESVPPETFDRLTKFVDDAPDAPDDAYRKAAHRYVTECIEYRETIRPDSLHSLEALPDAIQRTTAGGWVQYHSSIEDVEHDVPESEANTFDHGKYLFFAPGKARVLEDIVVEQFQQRPFRGAKLPTKPAKREDWVLCLYQADNRYWYSLRDEYNDPPTVRFRGFKTDNATRQGEYSERFREASDGA